MEKKKDLSIVNCIATSLLAYFITVPGHEFLHLLTYMAYGAKIVCYSAGAVEGIVQDFSVLSPFHRIMVAGGSASIINAIFGIILLIILLTLKMGPLVRVFLTQLMGAQMVQGIGYFLIGGLFSIGDWGNVYKRLPEYPGLVTGLHVVLSILGCVGIVALFFILNYMSYYFIENKDNGKERVSVAFKLHLLILILGFTIGMIISAISPMAKTGELNLGMGFIFNLMWIPFFWGFMFTGPMKTLPPKMSRFQYPLPAKPNYVLLAVSVVLILVDIFVFGPGIYFN